MRSTSARVGVLVLTAAVMVGCVSAPLTPDGRAAARPTPSPPSSLTQETTDTQGTPQSPQPDRPQKAEVVRTAASTDRWVVAVGDIAACSETADEVVAGLVGTMSAATLLTLGDNAYPDGSTDDYASCYAPRWGAFKGRTRPVPGNHDYRTSNAAPYYAYFGAAAGDPAKGWYSFDLGLWHMVALNSNCTEAGGCGPGSPQEQWLRADLWAHRGHACTLAYMHHPRFSSGDHGPQSEVDALWRALYAARADVVLSGHDHDYERFAPQTPDGTQVSYGIRQFVVGTGGASLRSFRSTEPNSVYRQSTAFGALRLYLGARGYAWTFLNTGGSAMDSGSFPCATP